ncbi:MAG: TIGR02679 family protein [Clostridia bacterium]|nr:TIGR02679 family protein [Clostridia bacterium]
MGDKLLSECVNYFKTNAGFKRILEGMRKKYLSLGTAGGTVVLQKLSREERDALSGFLRKDYSKNSSASIKLSDFQKALGLTRFKGVLVEDVLKEYFKEELIPFSIAEEISQEKRNRFFNAFIDKFRGTPGGLWLNAAISQKDYGYKTIIQRYAADPESIGREIDIVCKSLNSLPVRNNLKLRMPVFAASIAADPHILDESTSCGQLFMYGLAYTMGAEKPQKASERAELLYSAGILIDEVSNWVLCYGINAYLGNGAVHPAWKDFFENGEPLQATLLNLSRLSRMESIDGRVFVVENPSVFSSILDASCARSTADPVSIVCTYGQVSLAGLVMLDMLASSGSEIWYSGDFDPEGVLIAERLKQRFGAALKFWRYSLDDYLASVSDCAIVPSRLKQLDKVVSPELELLVREIRRTGLCGYQETILDRLLGDVLDKNKC